MKSAVIPIAALVILLCVISSGCASNTGPAPEATTPVPATVSTTVPTTRIVSVTASPAAAEKEPVQQMPPAQQVNVELTKDRPTSEIHLLYQGGPGDIFTQKIMMRVYSSANDYLEYVMNDGKKPIPGDEIVAPGTRGSDRCEVFVYSAGTRYKVLDQQVVLGRY